MKDIVYCESNSQMLINIHKILNLKQLIKNVENIQ